MPGTVLLLTAERGHEGGRGAGSPTSMRPLSCGKTAGTIRFDQPTPRRCRGARSARFGSIGRWAVLMLFSLTPVASVSTDIMQAVENGRDLVSGRAQMRVVPPAKIKGDGGVCGTETCWLGKNTRSSLDLRQPGERQAKYSQDSYAAALVSGATQHSKLKGSSGDMIDERILKVLRLLAPDAYFFAIERATQYEVVASPSVYAPSALPTGTDTAKLVIVWRRVGLEFLLHRVDLDLCPTWETCHLGSLPQIGQAAYDAARAKPLGTAAMAALGGAHVVLPPEEGRAEDAPVDGNEGGGDNEPPRRPVDASFQKDVCRPKDLSGTQAAFAASPFPVFPSSDDWVLAASSRFRTCDSGYLETFTDGKERCTKWICITPWGSPRCWRDEAAALAAVKRAEAQNPGYTLAQRAMRDDDLHDGEDGPTPSNPDYYTEGFFERPIRLFNYPIPGEKPYVPNSDNSDDAYAYSTYTHNIRWTAPPLGPEPPRGYWDKLSVASLAPKIYIRYPQEAFDDPYRLDTSCPDCLDFQRSACDRCEFREHECLHLCPQAACPSIQLPPDCMVADMLQSMDTSSPEVRLIDRECESCRKDMAFHYEYCQSHALNYCRKLTEGFTWSGNMDPK